MIFYWNIQVYCQQNFPTNIGTFNISESDHTVLKQNINYFKFEMNKRENLNEQYLQITQTNTFETDNTVTDIDGNKYHTVTIGFQTWLRENLRTSRYRNGDTIPEIAYHFDWGCATNGAWCWFDNNHTYDTSYGKLYNWYAVDDSRGLCPTGWHVSSDIEWQVLEFLLSVVQGYKLKEFGTKHWEDYGGDNESGFTGRPGGQRLTNGGYLLIRQQANWWTSSWLGPNVSIYRRLEDGSDTSTSNYEDHKNAFSVRCVKD